MIGPTENVPEAVDDEAQRRLVPARIEPQKTGVAVSSSRARPRQAAGSPAPW